MDKIKQKMRFIKKIEEKLKIFEKKS